MVKYFHGRTCTIVHIIFLISSWNVMQNWRRRTGGLVVVFLCTALFFGNADVVSAKMLKAKTYKKNYTLKNGEVLEGAGAGKTTIKGNITVRDKGVLRNLTIKGGQIALRSGASLTVENVTIDRAPGTAIETRGGGTLIVRNSRIINTRGKAFYIQRGKHIIITGTTVRGSGEEGIDIRSGVSGVISGNVVTKNAESGIEVILGNSALKITKNVLSNNGASGIAAQYYTLAKKRGKLTIAGNTIQGNKSYGLVCKTPSGGHPGDTYWRDSMHLEDNVVSGNKFGSFDKRCAVRNINLVAVRKARKVAMEAKRKAAEEAARKKAEAERRRKEIAQQRQVLTAAEAALPEHVAQITQAKRALEETPKVTALFGGFPTERIEALQKEAQQIDALRTTVDELFQQDLEDRDRIRATFLKEQLERLEPALTAYVAQQERFGLRRRVMQLF